MKLPARLVSAIVLLGILLPLSAAANPVKKGALQVELITEETAIRTGGKTCVGLLLKHDKGWHTYWSHPGIVGMTPRLKWDLPKGVTAGEVRWAMPERTLMGPYKCYGYENDALHIIELIADDDVEPGSEISIKLNVFWLVCNEACIVNSADLEVKLPVVAKGSNVPKSARAGLFEATRKAWPRKVEGWTFDAREQKDTYTLAFQPPKGAEFPEENIHFINEGTEVHSDRPQKLEKRKDGSFVFTLARFTEMAGKPERFKGILLNPDGWDAGGQLKAIRVDTPLDRSAVESANGKKAKKSD